LKSLSKPVTQHKAAVLWHKSPLNPSFTQLALRYVAHASVQPNTSQLNTRIDHLGQALLDFFGDYPIADISKQSVKKFAYQMQDQGWQAKKIDTYLVTFRACMKFAVAQNWHVDSHLTRPLSLSDEALLADQPLMTDNEFDGLYQSLVQELSDDLFH